MLSKLCPVEGCEAGLSTSCVTPARAPSASRASRVAPARPCQRQRRGPACRASEEERTGPSTGLPSAPSLLDSRPARPDEEASTSGRERHQGTGAHGRGELWPYRLIAALAAGGVLETSYLTWAKFFDTEVVCPTSGSCDTVLTSGYAYVFGVPLSLFGLLAYGTVGYLAWREGQRAERGERPERRGTQALERYGLLGGAVALAATSAYLLTLLKTQFAGETCTWCLTSAALSASIFVAALRALRPGEVGRLAAPGAGVALATALGLSLAWGNVQVADAFELEYMEPPVVTQSSPRAVELARRLKDAGAKFYGAFWCTHCFDQKEAFGREALGDLPYVECYPDGVKPNVKAKEECRNPSITGFPAWIINGKTYTGEKTLDELDKLLASK